MSNTENNKRIAKNTMFLYFRMLLTMVVSLFTSRVVLNTLGVEDFGIYNVVGGVIIMFSFINNAMASSTQRYLSFEIGKGDLHKLKNVFNTSFQIHLLIALGIVILGETLGLWFFYTKLNIPAERFDAAFWVYQFSIVSSVIMILNVPYNALVIAHERMNIFAYFSILDVVLKLIIVYLLVLSNIDKLVFYSFLIATTALIMRILYLFYCKKYFSESKLSKSFDQGLFKEMFKFAGWNLFGNLSYITYTQGLNILLNIFFSPVVNAARSIAVQVQTAITGFIINFQTAVNPQITKAYANNDHIYVHSLIFKSSKYSFYIIFILTLPIIFRTNQILEVWLQIVPEHTINFVRLMLITSIIDSCANPLVNVALATGKIKVYQTIISSILLLILPISYLALKSGFVPESVFIIHFLFAFIAFIARIFIVKPMINLSIFEYFLRVVKPIVLIILFSAIPLYYVNQFLNDNLFGLAQLLIIELILVFVIIYTFGLEKNEKILLKNVIYKTFNKIIRK